MINRSYFIRYTNGNLEGWRVVNKRAWFPVNAVKIIDELFPDVSSTNVMVTEFRRV